MLRRTLLAALLLGAIPVPTMARAEDAPRPLKVVTSFSILADMVQEIGGERVAVTSLIGPDGDAHAFEPTPAAARALAGAGLVVVNGLGFEGWIERLVAASGYRGPVIVASEGVTPRALVEDGVTVADPHAWQDLRNGRLYVRTIARALAVADPAHASAYDEAARRYGEAIAAADGWVRAEIAKVPAEQRKVVTSHDAFGYFGAAYGIDLVAAQGVAETSEPSAAELRALIDQIRAERIKVLFLENALSPRLAQQIAEETGAVLGGTLYADSLSPADGPAPDYLAIFRHNVPLLRDAMLASAGQG